MKQLNITLVQGSISPVLTHFITTNSWPILRNNINIIFLIYNTMEDVGFKIETNTEYVVGIIIPYIVNKLWKKKGAEWCARDGSLYPEIIRKQTK